MTGASVNLAVKVPEALRKRVRAVAALRGHTIAVAGRTASAAYVARSEGE